jgi:DNA-binding transcriptional LysR family regulator
MTDPRLTLETSKGRADWADYRVFGAVVKHGSFNAAARALGMNQAGLSRRVRDLEIRLNVKLLDRRHDGVQLTEAGELIFDHIVSMEHSAASIEKLVVDRERRAEGRVVLSTPDGIASFLLAPAMPEFLSENPAIQLVLDCGLSPHAPVSGRPEVYLQFERPSDPEMVAEPIAHVHWCVFAAQSYVDLYGKPTSLPQAADHRAVDLTLYGQYDREGWTSKAEAFMNLRTINVQTNSSAVLFLSVSHGAGVSPLPTYALACDPDLVLLDHSTTVTLPLWMCHHRDLSHSARIRKVEDWLRTIFDSRKKPWFRKEFIHPDEFMELARAHAYAFWGRAKSPQEPEVAPRRTRLQEI